MDIFDRATELEERQREQALQRQAERLPAVDPRRWKTLSAKWCEAPACGERIPDARRRAMPGVRLCVDCQDRMERVTKMRQVNGR